MIDPVPHNRHPVGRFLSLLFHPLVIFIPTLVVVLKDADPVVAVGWVALIAAVIFALAMVVLTRLRRQGRETYQRDARHQIYLSFWVSMVLCAALGVALDAATSADEAVEKSETASYDAALVDLVMPGRDGAELSQTLRRRFPGLPIGLLTGYAHSPLIPVIEKSGMAVFKKPVLIQDLVEFLQREIG